MATDNKAVTCYLPKELEESITEYCVKNGLLRKDKKGLERPSFGTAIVEILSDYFNIDSSNESNFNELKTQIEKLVIEKVMDKVNDYYNVINEEIDQKIKLLDKEKDINFLIEKINILEKELKNTVKEKSNTSNVLKEQNNNQLSILEDNNLKMELRPFQLAKRFSVTSPAITKYRNKSNQEFVNWTKKKDPDNIEWNFRQLKNKSYIYFPSGNVNSQLLSKLQEWIKENIETD